MKFHFFGNRQCGFGGSIVADEAEIRGLKECPFCGCRDSLSIENTHTPFYWVQCACGAAVSPSIELRWNPRQLKSVQAAHEEAFAEAVRRWNGRRPNAERPSLVEEA